MKRFPPLRLCGLLVLLSLLVGVFSACDLDLFSTSEPESESSSAEEKTVPVETESASAESEISTEITVDTTEPVTEVIESTDPAETDTDPAETDTDPVETDTDPAETETEPDETDTDPVETDTDPDETGSEPDETGTEVETETNAETATETESEIGSEPETETESGEEEPTTLSAPALTMLSNGWVQWSIEPGTTKFCYRLNDGEPVDSYRAYFWLADGETLSVMACGNGTIGDSEWSETVSYAFPHTWNEFNESIGSNIAANFNDAGDVPFVFPLIADDGYCMASWIRYNTGELVSTALTDDQIELAVASWKNAALTADFVEEETTPDGTVWYRNPYTGVKVGYALVAEAEDEIFFAYRFTQKTPAVHLLAPAVTVGSDGIARWKAVPEASGYLYRIDEGEPIETTETSVSLSEGQTLTVMAKGDGLDAINSAYSLAKTRGETISLLSKEDLEAFGDTFGYRMLGELPMGEGMQSLYREIDEIAFAFHGDFETDLTEDTQVPGYYQVGSCNYEQYGLSADDVATVDLAYRIDHPIYYWLSTGYLLSDTTFFLCTTEAYANGEDRAVYYTLITESAAELAALCQGESEIETIEKTYREICRRMYYAFQADGKTPEDAEWAHSITGLFTRGGGVCECYAMAFNLILNHCGVDCITVTGVASSGGEAEFHAWSLVRVGDEWFWCDTTWDDDPDGRIGDRYYCVGDAQFTDHTPEAWFSLPERAVVTK